MSKFHKLKCFPLLRIPIYTSKLYSTINSSNFFLSYTVLKVNVLLLYWQYTAVRARVSRNPKTEAGTYSGTQGPKERDRQVPISAISNPETEGNEIMKRNLNVGHVGKSVIGRRTRNAKHPLEQFTKMHPKEQSILMLKMERRKSGTNVRYASSIETQGNASLEQSASLSLSMINITVQI